MDEVEPTEMPIQDLAREDVIRASPETPIAELAQQMRDEKVGSVVITNDDSLAGIVTDRDLTVRVLAEGTDPGDQTANDVMSTELCAVGPDTGFYEAAQMMSENGVRRLPICDENDELVGIITADDLTELLSDETQQLASIIQAQRPAY
jgi:signal-transduction protein with cAMP-binding, CBS, and nucleotidyltransferase domain